jgi:hypothetical protein
MKITDSASTAVTSTPKASAVSSRRGANEIHAT